MRNAQSKAVATWKPDIFGFGVIAAALAAAGAAAYAAVNLGWFKSWWDFALWLGVSVVCLAAWPAGHVALAPRNTKVHGAAEAASEWEAQAAARGDVKAPMHDQTFPD